MSLEPGTMIGPYEVVAAIGKGGMGEVFRARDTRLGRDVAIKVLPQAFADDPDRLARFTREAQMLAALNHPNIAHIYGVEQGAPLGDARGGVSGSRTALVMEFVDGEDLTAHIARAPIPWSELVPIAAQIATGLEAAHDHGIIHRDLKPANIKVRADGVVKILDFGLAKAAGPDAAEASSEAMNSPTLTARATAMGVIIGTAAYMAPEQAKGKPVDRRADIWAFGVVLYEMLTGRRAFDGEDVSTTLAAVLMKDPDWGPMPASTPRAIRTLVERCLQRDPKLRLRDIGEARIVLNDPAAVREAAPAAAAEAPAPSMGRGAMLIAGAIVAAALIVGVAVRWSGADVAAGERLTVSLSPPLDHSFARPFALSPDGKRLAIPISNDTTGTYALWLRDLSTGQITEIPHTEGGWQPFWSPEGTDIGFFADNKLKRVDLQGSPPQVLCDAPSPRGGTWGPDNTIVFAGAFREGLQKIDARGGKPAPLTTTDDKRKEKSHRWPVFLPGGKDILFLAQTGEGGSKDDASGIEVLTLATSTRTRLINANSSPVYSPAGFILFWRDGALRAQAFDAASRTVSGEVLLVANGVMFDNNEWASASLGGTGTLVYATGSGETLSSMLVTDREGRIQKTIVADVSSGGTIALSHDDSRLAIARVAGNSNGPRIWIFDLARETSRAVTFEEGFHFNPAWSHDDSQIAYTNELNNDGQIYRRLSDGRGERQLAVEHVSGTWLFEWSNDDKWMLLGATSGTGGQDIFRAPVGSKTLTPLVNSSFSEDSGALSANNRWLAYSSDQSGRTEVYVRPLSGEGRWPVSDSGGATPAWRRDGRELYYVTPRNQLMAVSVEEVGQALRFGTPKALFHADFASWDTDRSYAPFADGKRFVIAIVPNKTTDLLTLVTNWTGPSRSVR